ncbi:MAG: aspartate carbamoyltransferase catalytic subunit [Rickettsiales bacterium]|nr:aspartate carbamoyltransferase catalytic subunit [Rickettsiales bacterium]
MQHWPKLSFLKRATSTSPLGFDTKRTYAHRAFPHRDLLGIEALSAHDILTILDLADHYVERNRALDKKHPILKGRTLINLFFENSTRTRTSFELAGKRLGADVINMSVASSSVKKGETLIDTAMTLNAMRPDFIAIRHPESGAVHLLAQKVNCAVINAGDGGHEHPTQALLDALTIRRKRGRIEGLRVAICGDVLNSRVARSNMLLLQKLGAHVAICAPRTLMPCAPEQWGAEVHFSMKGALQNADIVMMLRIQTERMSGQFVPSPREYFHRFGLDRAKLSFAKPDALVMHPGPINRGIEIDTDIADDIERSVILDQVEMGVAVRQAVLELLGAQHG